MASATMRSCSMPWATGGLARVIWKVRSAELVTTLRNGRLRREARVGAAVVAKPDFTYGRRFLGQWPVHISRSLCGFARSSNAVTAVMLDLPRGRNGQGRDLRYGCDQDPGMPALSHSANPIPRRATPCTLQSCYPPIGTKICVYPCGQIAPAGWLPAPQRSASNSGSDGFLDVDQNMCGVAPGLNGVSGAVRYGRGSLWRDIR